METKTTLPEHLATTTRMLRTLSVWTSLALATTTTAGNVQKQLLTRAGAGKSSNNKQLPCIVWYGGGVLDEA